jgi:hypothetical protein
MQLDRAFVGPRVAIGHDHLKVSAGLGEGLQRTGQGSGVVVDLFSPKNSFLYCDCHRRSSFVSASTFVAPIFGLSQALVEKSKF